MSDSDEWETVPESAKRLGIGERKAHRHAAKLSDSDIKVSDSLSLETERLRRDLARGVDENQFMREQLSMAMSDWREEQRRTRELESVMNFAGLARVFLVCPLANSKDAPWKEKPILRTYPMTNGPLWLLT